VIGQTYEQAALATVGPLLKAKEGAKYIPTAACMTTTWPEAVPLRTITAKAVAEASFEIFSRMGLPLEILTDNST